MSAQALRVASSIAARTAAGFLALVLIGLAVPAEAQFAYRPAGELASGSGRGRVDSMVYAPGMRFPIERAPAYLNSQVWGVGGSQGPSGSQCDMRNFSYPWRDNYCESRSWTMPMCPAGTGHQGQDIRGSNCMDNVHNVVAVTDGTITSIGSYSVYLTAADGTRFDYLHMRSVAVTVGQRVRRGAIVGRVSNSFGGTPTTVHLHFNIRMSVTGFGQVYAPTYMSLVRAYEALLGTSMMCTPEPEVCDGRDNDCDGMTDEGVSNACGGCGPVPAEVCDGRDNDCDGMIDEARVCDEEEVALQSAALEALGSSDLDGDGRADACARSPAGIVCHRSDGTRFGAEIAGPMLGDMSGWRDVSNFSTIRMADVTGDGRADLCARANDRLICFASTGDGFGARFDGPAWSDAGGWSRASQFSTIRMADVNGDGRADVCGRSALGFECHISNGTGFEQPMLISDLSDANGFDAVQYYGTIRMADLDADGKADVCARTRVGISCWLSRGNAFAPAMAGPEWSDGSGWNAVQYWATIRLADVDGDRRADVCGRGVTGWRCHRSEPGGFGPAMMSPGLSDMTGWSDVDNYSTIRLADVDGDRRADVCGRANAGVFCWLFRDGAFTTMVTGPALSDARGWDDPQFYRTIRFADVDGDGAHDVCARGVDGLHCWRSERTRFGAEIANPPAWDDATAWDEPRYYTTIRVQGPECRAIEVCNGRDDDCDGVIDNACVGGSDAGTVDGASADVEPRVDAQTDGGGGGVPVGGCACRVNPSIARAGTRRHTRVIVGIFLMGSATAAFRRRSRSRHSRGSTPS